MWFTGRQSWKWHFSEFFWVFFRIIQNIYTLLINSSERLLLFFLYSLVGKIITVSVLSKLFLSLLRNAKYLSEIIWFSGLLLFRWLLQIRYTYPTWLNWQSYTLTKEDPKNFQIRWDTPWNLLTLVFSPEASNFC